MLVVDIETTGIDPRKNAIIEIGAVDFLMPQRRFSTRVRAFDGALLDPESLLINGFTEEEVFSVEANEPSRALREFYDWSFSAQVRTIAGQNCDFDMGFLRAAFHQNEIPWIFGVRKVDQHSLAYAHMLRSGVTPPHKDSVSGLNSDAIMEYVGLPAEPKPHRALNGALYEAEALSRLVFGKNLLPEFSGFPIPKHLL